MIIQLKNNIRNLIEQSDSAGINQVIMLQMGDKCQISCFNEKKESITYLIFICSFPLVSDILFLLIFQSEGQLRKLQQNEQRFLYPIQLL